MRVESDLVVICGFLQNNSIFYEFSIFSKYHTALCKFSFFVHRLLIKLLFIFTLDVSCIMFFVIFMAYEARLIIFNNMSFGKTIETKFIFFYKLSSFRESTLLKSCTVHQHMIIFTKPEF